MIKIRTLLYLSIILIHPFSIAAQGVNYDWAYGFGNPSIYEGTTTITADGENYYVAGEFSDTAIFGEQTLIAQGLHDIFLSKFDHQGGLLWVNHYGSAEDEYVKGLTIDVSGNVFISGTFSGTTVIGNVTLQSNGGQDVFVAATSSEGNFEWASSFGGPGTDYNSGIKTDNANDLVLYGMFYDSIQTGVQTIVSQGASDIYLIRYDPNGDLIWAFSAGGYSSDEIRSIDYDENNNYFISGSFFDEFIIADTLITTSDPTGIYLSKLSPDGSPDWVHVVHGTSLGMKAILTCNDNNEIYFAGNFQDSIWLGNNLFISGTFDQNIYLAKFSNSGEILWSKMGGSYSSDDITYLDTDEDDNIYLGGHYLADFNIGSVSLTYTLCCGFEEIFIIKLDGTGKDGWGKQISGALGANIHAIEVTGNDELYAAGVFYHDLQLDSLHLYNSGFNNYVSKLSSGLFTDINPVNASSNQHFVYPNPVKDQCRISGLNAGGMVRITDLSGKQVFNLRNVANGQSLDLSSLESGTYLIQVFDTDQNRLATELLVKN